MGSRIKYLMIALVSMIFLMMFTLAAQVMLYQRAVQNHHFTYQLGEKVKVKDVIGFVTYHTLKEDFFTFEEEQYTIVIENSNATMFVNVEEIQSLK